MKIEINVCPWQFIDLDVLNLEYQLMNLRCYNPPFVYFLPFFLKVNNVFSRRYFQKILPLCMVSIQEWVMMARLR